MKIELIDDAVQALRRLGTVTNRSPNDVLADALRTYEWILHEQFYDRKIVSMNGSPERELVNFVVDKSAAEKYFLDFCW